jgi:hypothetical protein
MNDPVTVCAPESGMHYLIERADVAAWLRERQGVAFPCKHVRAARAARAAATTMETTRKGKRDGKR